MKAIIAILTCFFAQSVAAWQCPDGLDPYDVVKSAFDESDLVFVGRIVEQPVTRTGALVVDVEKKWKGPEVRTVSMNYSWQPEQYSNLYFAARSDQPPGWTSLFPLCFPSDSSLTIEQILNAGAGDPAAPNERAMAIASATFIGVLVLAGAGLALFQRTFLRRA